MAKFYGSIQGNRGAATRMGNSSIKSSVQSYNGSLISYMSYVGDKLMLELCVSEGSASSGKTIFYGTFEEFVNKFERED